MKLSTSLKIFSALAIVGSAFANTEVPPVETPTNGTKSTVTLALTLTEEIGGFVIKDTLIATEAAKFITYDNVRNPRGFDAATAKKNYYEQKHTIKYRVPAQMLDQTENTTAESLTLLTTKYGNAQFLTDLVARGIIPSNAAGMAKAIAGYSIVAVQFSSEDFPRFFVEKAGVAPIYIGRFADGGDGFAGENPLMVGSAGSVEQRTSTSSTKTKYSSFNEQGTTYYQAVLPPTVTYAEKFSGQDDSYFVINRADGSSVSTAGTLKFSGTYDAATHMIVTGPVSATVAGSAGLESEGSEQEPASWSVYAIAAGTIKLGKFIKVANLSAYEAALY